MEAGDRHHNSLLNFAETIQGQGRYCFTKQEAMQALGITPTAFGKAAHRLIQQTKLMRVRNGFYAVVPPEYRIAKGLPPTFIIDALMRFAKQPYYIGVLSAAAFHGAAHQAPQELQVVTTKPLPVIETGNSRIRFLTKKWLKETPVQSMKTQTGLVQVSSPEATAFDLLRYIRIAGYLDNVTTVLVELSDTLSPRKLAEAAAHEKELSYAQRLGYLLDRFAAGKHTKTLHARLMKQDPSPTFLRPDQRKGVTQYDEKWRVFVNTEVNPDI